MVTAAQKQQLLMTQVEDCEARQDLLNEWEQNFIDSISKRLDSTGLLTMKQEQTLNKIWERVTDEQPGSQRSRKEW